MRKIFKFVAAFALISGLAISFNSLAAHAQTDTNDKSVSSVTLSPAVNKLTFNAGDQISDKMTVINNGNEAYTFVVYAGPFSVKDENYSPDYTTVNKNNQSYQWVQFKNTTYKLKPGQRVDVPYTITVPKDAAPGGHYAVLFAETQPPAEKNTVARKKRVGSLLYMTVNGNIKLSGSVSDWTAQFWQKNSPIISDIYIKNDGNTHFQADITATYKDIFGKQKFQLNQQALILPGTTRRLPVVWKNTPAFGIFKVSGSVKMLGHTEQLPQKYIILAPYWLLYVLLGVIVLLAAPSVIKKIKSKRNGRSDKKSQK